MFHNVLMTSLTPLRNTNEINHWQNRPFTTIWPEESFNATKNTDVKRVIKKKNKRHRTNFTTDQTAALEQTFIRLRYINSEIRKQLSNSLKISERSVKIWFQNRRMKEKKELSECSDSSADTPAELVFPRPPRSSVSSTHEIENPESQFGNKHLGGGRYQSPNFHFCHYQQYEQSSTVPSDLPTEPIVDDINAYPTYYYPTMEDYYLRESFRYDSDCINSNDVQWSANNFDLNFFQ